MEAKAWKTGLDYLVEVYGEHRVSSAMAKLGELVIEVPSWGFGRGGTRFGSFIDGSERDLAGRLAEAGKLYQLTGQGKKVAFHFPWDGEGRSVLLRSRCY